MLGFVKKINNRCGEIFDLLVEMGRGILLQTYDIPVIYKGEHPK